MFEKFYKKSDLLSFCEMAKLECNKSWSKDEIVKEIKIYLNEYKYAPRYLRDLNENEKYLKKFEIRFNLLREKYGKISKKELYSPTKSDKIYLSKKSPKKSSKRSSSNSPKKTERKISKYTDEWNKKYPDCKSISCKSKVSGVPKSILEKVANKGAGAWRGGSHRPGASRENWMVSRVNSFLLCGKTWTFPDHLLAKEALKSPRVQKFWRNCDKKKLGVKTPSK
jgi:hypothetical protein